jgi:hypothetical protein
VPTRPDSLTVRDVQALLKVATPDWVAVNQRFRNGDHWQSGNGWIGPMLAIGDPNWLSMLNEIQRAFVSKNAIAEGAVRHVAGVAGREMEWGLTVRRPLKEGKKPTRAEQALIDEAEALLTEWWDERGAHSLIQQAADMMACTGRSCIRLFVPDGEREDGDVPQADLKTSLFRIYAQVLEPHQATVATDSTTMRPYGLYLYTEDQQTFAEVVYRDGTSTVIRVTGSDTAADDGAVLDLDGHLTVHELKRAPLVTEQVRQNQKLLNLAKTMLGRNVVQGGFLERFILNGERPGKWVDDPSQPDGKRFVPSPMRLGAGTTNWINGIVTEDKEGNEEITSPSVVFRDPVKIDTFEGTERNAYRSILEEMHQLHALISGDATPSGEARRQAMADFIADLFITKAVLDRAGRWLLETLLELAAIFAGQPGRYRSLRATFKCRLNPGPISPDEIRLVIELVRARLMSRETAMSRADIEDVDEELAKIEVDSKALGEQLLSAFDAGQ